MDINTLREIARVIAEEQSRSQWPTYALVIVLSGLAGFFSSYIGAYARKRGENFATKADFEGLLAQQKLTTSVAEEVKSKISHSDWVNRESTMIRRAKLEELLHTVYEVQAWVDADRSQRFFASQKDPGASPMPRFEVLARLYFPELSNPVSQFCQFHQQGVLLVLESHNALLEADKDLQQRQALISAFKVKWAPIYQGQLKAIASLESECRNIMATLLASPTYDAVRSA